MARGDLDINKLRRGIAMGHGKGCIEEEGCNNGTLGFRSPELLSRQGPDSCGVDVFSAGVVMACIMSKKYPFFDLCRQSTSDEAWVEIVKVLGYRIGMKVPSSVSRIQLNAIRLIRPPSLTDLITG